MFPILGNPSFQPGMEVGAFNNLIEQGCFQASHFLQSEALPTINSLKQPGGLYEINFWQALQLCNFLRSLGSPTNFQRQLTTFELYCEDTEPLPRVISKMYALLNNPWEDFVMPSINKWERNLNSTFTPVQLKNTIYLSLSSLICTQIQEFNYKLLMQWFYTSTRLHKFSIEASDRCWWCGEELGSLLHIFWSCSKIRQFWLEFQKIAQKFTEFVIPDDPAFFLLHCSQIPVQIYKSRY